MTSGRYTVGLLCAFVSVVAAYIVEYKENPQYGWVAQIPLGVASVAYEVPILALCFLCCYKGKMPWLIFKEAFEFADIREAPPQLRVAWVLSFIVFFFSPLVMVIATSQLRAVENLGKFVCEKKHDHITRAIDGCDVSDDLRMPTEDEMHHIHEAVDIGWPIILFSSISLMTGFGGMLLTKASHTVHYVYWVFLTIGVSIFLLTLAVYVQYEVQDLHIFCDNIAQYEPYVPSSKVCENQYNKILKDTLNLCTSTTTASGRTFSRLAEMKWFTHGDLYCAQEGEVNNDPDFVHNVDPFSIQGCNCHCKESTELTCEPVRREAVILNVFVWICSISMFIAAMAAGTSPRGTAPEPGEEKTTRQPLSRKATRSRLERKNTQPMA
mmetsp:Transcript_10656/g.27671  ORF Transcript_10656/g.27671 Transcript_10656/m.27671 type:complete len:381 (+) Transcript_10656:83-1225(+)